MWQNRFFPLRGLTQHLVLAGTLAYLLLHHIHDDVALLNSVTTRLPMRVDAGFRLYVAYTILLICAPASLYYS